MRRAASQQILRSCLNLLIKKILVQAERESDAVRFAGADTVEGASPQSPCNAPSRNAPRPSPGRGFSFVVFLAVMRPADLGWRPEPASDCTHGANDRHNSYHQKCRTASALACGAF